MLLARTYARSLTRLAHERLSSFPSRSFSSIIFSLFRRRYWDADRFRLITNIGRHEGEAWCVAVSGDGATFVSGGHDRALRIWRRSQEPVFAEEEEERRMSAMCVDRPPAQSLSRYAFACA